MDVPGIVESTLAGEDVAAEVSLGGENVLYVTPTRTLVYQSEGFLSDESVDEYPHEAERMTVKEGRRKTRITLEYSLDGARDFTVPANVSEAVVHPVLAGVLNASGVTNPGETVTQTFRFSELTVVITSERLVKHVGGAVWDEDYEEYHFADVTGLSFEDGSVATQVVLEVDGRPERIKIANDRAAEVKEYLQQSLFAYYDVRSLDALNDAVRPDEADEEERPSPIDFGEGVDPLDAGNTVQPDEVTDVDGTVASMDEVPDEPETTGTPATSTGEAAQPPRQQGQEQRTQQGSQQVDEARPEQQSDPLAGGSNTSAGAETNQYEQAPVSQDQPASDPAARQSQQRQPAHEERGPPQHEQTPQANQQASAQPQTGQVDQRPARSSQPNDAADAADSQGTLAAESSTAQTEQASESPPEPEPDPSDTERSVDQDPVTAQEAASGDDGADTDSPFEAAGFQPATADETDEAVIERLDSLERQVETQNELLERQGKLIQQLIDELSRSR
ncbi:DUF7115 domain-containing protein [Haloarchaeobius sp. DT45]|uniref:DUF7115 domain-containing protein n=1 Tax=Haloarchaeobius sp. DT45 TaxID=3446116 RepID=UPI003F6D01FC